MSENNDDQDRSKSRIKTELTVVVDEMRGPSEEDGALADLVEQSVAFLEHQLSTSADRDELAHDLDSEVAQRKRAETARDRAETARDEAILAHDGLVGRRDELVRELAEIRGNLTESRKREIITARDLAEAVAERDRHKANCRDADEAIAARDKAVAEREEMGCERMAAINERTEAFARLDRQVAMSKVEIANYTEAKRTGDAARLELDRTLDELGRTRLQRDQFDVRYEDEVAKRKLTDECNYENSKVIDRLSNHHIKSAVVGLLIGLTAMSVIMAVVLMAPQGKPNLTQARMEATLMCIDPNDMPLHRVADGGYESMFMDEWENPIRVYNRKGAPILAISAGADQIYHTADDIQREGSK